MPSLTSIVTAVLVAGALCASVFFQGMQITVFSVTVSLLLLGLASVLWNKPGKAFAFPFSPMALALTSFWLWVAVTLFWSKVLYLSVLEFWSLSTMPIAFWIYTLAPDRERLWARLAMVALLGGVSLALYAMCQLFFLGGQPNSTFLNSNSHAALLNLIAIPCAAQFLASYRHDPRGMRPKLLALAFFLLVFAVALVKGRAAAITLGAGLLVVAGVAYRTVPRRALLVPAVLVVVAYALSALSWQMIDSQQALTGKFSELSAPLQAQSMRVRYQIWEATWQMIQAGPWYGVGVGLFPLLYPSYRIPHENSAGFLVHNDYLELWLEAGLPGVLLIVTAFIFALALFVRALRNKALSADQRLQLTGLFAGSMAIAAHSFVDFNFHIVAILILLGLMLARFQQLARPRSAVWELSLRIPSAVSAPVFRIVLVALLCFPALYFGTITLAMREADTAQRLGKEGRLDEADFAYRRAYRYYPTADNVLVNHADLYRLVLTYTPRKNVEERRLVFDQALEFLDQGERLNPLRPLNFLVRAQIYEQNTDLLGEGTPEKIERAYREALRLNPRFYPARLSYGTYLKTRGRIAEARDVAETGMREFYFEHEAIIPYFTFVARLRAEAGDREGARALKPRMEQAMLNSGYVRVQRPEDIKPLEPPGRPAS